MDVGRSSDDKVIYCPEGVTDSDECPENDIKHSTKQGNEYKSEKTERKRRTVEAVSGNDIEAGHVPGNGYGETLIRDIISPFKTATQRLSSFRYNIQEQHDWIQSVVCQSNDGLE